MTIQLLRYSYLVSIITQKDILFINRMNLYLREGFWRKGFPIVSGRIENCYGYADIERYP